MSPPFILTIGAAILAATLIAGVRGFEHRSDCLDKLSSVVTDSQAAEYEMNCKGIYYND